MPRGRGPSPTANRTDLAKPAPVTTVPDQPYGAQTQQAAAQRAVPMAGGQNVTPDQGGAQSSPQGGQPDIAAMMQQHAQAGNGADAHANFTRPTERPDEPVTHGLPLGPGGGPDVHTGIGAVARDGAIEQSTLSNFLQSVSSQPGATSALKDLAAHAMAGNT